MNDILTSEQISTIEFAAEHGLVTHQSAWRKLKFSHEALRDLVEDLAGSLRDFGADQSERRGSMHKGAANALDLADQVLERSQLFLEFKSQEGEGPSD